MIDLAYRRMAFRRPDDPDPEVLREIRARRPDVDVVMISGHGTIETAVKAVRLGARDFVEKPLSLEKTLLVVRNSLRQRRLR